MTPDRTTEGKWAVFHRVTGQRFERWPVDARAMLESGAYTADPSDCQQAAATVAAAPDAPPVVPVPLPHEHSPGVPLVVTKSADASPGAPSPIPTGHTSKGRRAR